jgi:hypothetical protein
MKHVIGKRIIEILTEEGLSRTGEVILRDSCRDYAEFEYVEMMIERKATCNLMHKH